MNLDLDLNISNYTVEEIITLLKLPTDFDTEDLKKAKRMVLQLHPDKSGLSGDYFIFFMKAYTILKNILAFRNKINQEPNIHYNIDEFEYRTRLDSFFANNKSIEFSKWFNDLFDKVYDRNNHGYEEWFRCEDTKQSKTVQSKWNDISSVHSSTSSIGCELVDIENMDYTSTLNATLSFTDLVDAHSIPSDFNNNNNNNRNHNFKSVGELERFRSQDNLEPSSESESLQLLKREELKEIKQANNRAYQLQKDTAKNIERQQILDSALMRLK